MSITQVGVLIDAVQEPGRHSVTWDGSGLPSGIYFYTLGAGRVFRTKKLLLIH